jgi:hypothetical protein
LRNLERGEIHLIQNAEQSQQIKASGFRAGAQLSGNDNHATEQHNLPPLVRHVGSADRIILGEIHGTEARTPLDSVNTGHRGSLATIYASSAQGALLRLRTLLIRGTASLLPAEADAEILAAIHRVIHVDREGGQQHVREILELLE